MVNVVILVGHLCANPELRYTASGTAVANLRLAVNNTYTNAKGEKRENVLFIDVAAWGKQAESAAEYLEKGSKVLVEGELRLREWDDKPSGRRVSKIEVHAKSVQFLNFKKSNGDGATTQATAAVPAGQSDEDVPF